MAAEAVNSKIILNAENKELLSFVANKGENTITVNDGDIIHAGDMDFTAITLPGHTRCCVGFYCEKEGLLLSNETLGVYDGDKTILPAFLVSFTDTIHSVEKIEKLDIKHVLAPHFGLLDKAQTEYFLKNMKSSAQNIADDILGSMR